jgi:hypothetical protein
LSEKTGAAYGTGRERALQRANYIFALNRGGLLTRQPNRFHEVHIVVVQCNVKRCSAALAAMTVPKAESDGRDGSRFSIVMAAGEQEIPHAGTYLEVKPHSRIVFTWESPFSVDDSTVTLAFKPAGDGATEVELTHVRFADEESRNNHQGGWTGILEKLGEVLG